MKVGRVKNLERLSLASLRLNSLTSVECNVINTYFVSAPLRVLLHQLAGSSMVGQHDWRKCTLLNWF